MKSSQSSCEERIRKGTEDGLMKSWSDCFDANIEKFHRILEKISYSRQGETCSTFACTEVVCPLKVTTLSLTNFFSNGDGSWRSPCLLISLPQLWAGSGPAQVNEYQTNPIKGSLYSHFLASSWGSTLRMLRISSGWNVHVKKFGLRNWQIRWD